VLRELTDRLLTESAAAPAGGPVCRGTLLSRSQYLVDVDCWGYQDARLAPVGPLAPGQITLWQAEARAALQPPGTAACGEGPHDGEG
jgi:hypothetical protein